MEKTLWKKQVRKLGITQEEIEGLRLCWSASGIGFLTTANIVTVEMKAQSTTPQEDAFIGIFVNEEKLPRQKIRVVPGTKKYIIYEQETAETIRIRLVKLTEEQYGKVWITALTADVPVRKDEVPSLRLLFVGDSITAGYGVDGTNGVSVFQTKDEDVTKAYAYQTAEMLHADSRIVAYSGNGVLSRWIPPEQDVPYTEKILPEIFPYAQSEATDLIVCNLGTNDASYIRQIPSREEAFVKKYSDFIKRIKEAFPSAKILLLYGLMEQTLCESVKEIAQKCKTEFLKLPLQNPANGMGTDGHPSAITQREIAIYVTEYIQQKMMWRTDER